MINRLLRLISCSSICLFAVLATTPSALAGRTHHTMSPFLAIGPQAHPAGHAGPGYGLFTCQLGLIPGVVCYDPYQIRHAYQVDSLINAGYNGAGRTIVIIDAFQSPTLINDLDTFNSFYGLPLSSTFFTQIAPQGLTPFDPNNGDMVGWSGEITLDVEWAHAIAPNAKIVLVLAKSDEDQDILNALNYAVSHNLGDVISMSFGENESCVDPGIFFGYRLAFTGATLLGTTLFASSGDEGAAQETCDGTSWVKAASHPASDPLVTGVGGTELHAADYCLTALGCDPTKNPLPGTYLGEIAWNEPPGLVSEGSLSTGGGFSVLFAAPPYQFGTTKNLKQRAVPDIAYSAAVLHGVLTYWTGDQGAGFYLFGGTSAGSPQWAGITAIADQKAQRRLGFLNGGLYQIARLNKGPLGLTDILSGNNSVVEFDVNDDPVAINGFAAGKGWDATTGNGSPVGTTLVDYLNRYVGPFDGLFTIVTTPPPKVNGFPGYMGPH